MEKRAIDKSRLCIRKKTGKIDCELVKKFTYEKNAYSKYALSQIDFNQRKRKTYVISTFHGINDLRNLIKKKFRETKQSTRDEFSSILLGEFFNVKKTTRKIVNVLDTPSREGISRRRVSEGMCVIHICMHIVQLEI